MVSLCDWCDSCVRREVVLSIKGVIATGCEAKLWMVGHLCELRAL